MLHALKPLIFTRPLKVSNFTKLMSAKKAKKPEEELRNSSLSRTRAPVLSFFDEPESEKEIGQVSGSTEGFLS